MRYVKGDWLRAGVLLSSLSFTRTHPLLGSEAVLSSEACLCTLVSKSEGATIKGAENRSHDFELFCLSNLLLLTVE